MSMQRIRFLLADLESEALGMHNQIVDLRHSNERMRLALAHSACPDLLPDGTCPCVAICDCAERALDLWAPLSTEEKN